MPPAPRNRTAAELDEVLPQLHLAPKDVGALMLLVARPAVDERVVLAEGTLDRRVGLVGDTWDRRSSKRTEDGGPHPDMQLNVMGHRIAHYLAHGDRDRQALAGDQLFVDLDLSHDNLPAGTVLRIGDPAGARVDDPSTDGAAIVVTEQPHTGCAKFVARFGADAMRFVNGPVGRPLRLRGLNARVLVAGVVRPGDPVRVERP